MIIAAFFNIEFICFQTLFSSFHFTESFNHHTTTLENSYTDLANGEREEQRN